ncbi:MAG: DUF6273 domain-containing protein [Lachnospiraceae bacterium]|nr:DUF6273 domain-containing protein [Lachnospiraceae bacterium]
MGAVFVKILNMSLTAGWIVLAVLLVRLLLKRKAPKALFPVLWAFVAVRLLCPVTFESSISLIPDAEPVERITALRDNSVEDDTVQNSPTDNTKEETLGKVEPVDLPGHIGTSEGFPGNQSGLWEQDKLPASDEQEIITDISSGQTDNTPEEKSQAITEPEKEDFKQTPSEGSAIKEEGNEAPASDTKTTEETPDFPAKKTDHLLIAAVIWLVGIGSMLLYTVFSYVRIYKRVAESAPLSDNVRVCDHIGSPFILGIICPKIYLPSDVSEADKAYVLAHEKAHIRRLDHIWKPLGFLLLAVYWFHPLLWVAYILLCRDIEYACDEKVIKELGPEQKKPYSEALINCSVSKKMISACPLAFGENGVKGRVKSVLHYKKPAFWVLIVSVLVCVGMTVCFLTNPKEKSTDNATEPTLTPNLTGEPENLSGDENDTSGLKAGDIISFGTYEQDNRKENGAEPIEWIVLDIFDGKATLLSRYGLDAKPYHTTKTDVTWESCSLRSWLNTEFFESAFDADEKSHILTTKLENPKASGHGTSDGPDTTDKLYLLSVDEVQEIFELLNEKSTDVESDDFLNLCITTATAYAKAQEAWETGTGDSAVCAWLLRTPGEILQQVSRVSATGKLNYDVEVDYGGMAIRPAVRIKLSGAKYELVEAAKVTTEDGQGSSILHTRSARWKEVVPLSEAKAGYVVEFGAYEQDNVAENGAEPIEWFVLDVENGKALLLSRYILERMPYHEYNESVTWESCTLRKWLNEEFYQTAFTKEEKQHVIPTLLENVWNPWNPLAEYEYTEDKVFLPAMEDVLFGTYEFSGNYPEMSRYRFDGYFLTATERMAKCSAYADRNTTGNYLSGWLLRTNSHLSFYPSTNAEPVKCYTVPRLDRYGGFDNGYGYVENVWGVRPAIWVEINNTENAGNDTENTKNPDTSSESADSDSLASRLPSRYAYEEVKSTFLEFFNHQAYLYPSMYPQEAYDCTIDVYCTKESRMKRVYIKTVLNGEDTWFLCSPERYLKEETPLFVSRMSNDNMKLLQEKEEITYLGTDTIRIPAVTKPEYHKGNDTDMNQYKTSVSYIYEKLCKNGYLQKDGYRDVLKLEVWISEFDMEKKLFPHAYLVINDSKVYETTFTEYEGLNKTFDKENYTKIEQMEGIDGEQLYVWDVFDGRSIKPLSSIDEKQFERVKSCAVFHYVYEKDFTETLSLNGTTVTVPKQNVAISEEFKLGIAFIPHYTLSNVTHYNIYRSEDSGENWSLVAEDYTAAAGDIGSILLPTENRVVCYFKLSGVTMQSSCILSEDGGKTWSSPPQAAKPNTGLSNPSIGSSVVFGSYEQDNDSSNGTEPLEWIVLDRTDDKVLLLTKYVIEYTDYYDKCANQFWERSNIREWLYGNIYKSAFTAEERACILKTTNKNPYNADAENNVSNTTEDYVFLLSMDDVLYGKSQDGTPYFGNEEARLTVPTATAIVRNKFSSWLNVYDEPSKDEYRSSINTAWWLRTPGETIYDATLVTGTGAISEQGVIVYDSFTAGIRPAIWVDISRLNR